MNFLRIDQLKLIIKIFKGHRAHAVYYTYGFHVPGSYRRRGHRRHKHKNGNKKADDATLTTDLSRHIRPSKLMLNEMSNLKMFEIFV